MLVYFIVYLHPTTTVKMQASQGQRFVPVLFPAMPWYLFSKHSINKG